MSTLMPSVRPEPDQVIADIADYVIAGPAPSALALDTARACLIDTLGCGLEALDYPACTKLLGPIVPGTIVPNGAHVPGTGFVMDPGPGCLFAGCDDPLAGLQRHLAGGGMGTSVRQSGWHPDGGEIG